MSTPVNRIPLNGWIRINSMMTVETAEEEHAHNCFTSDFVLRKRVYTKELNRRKANPALPLRALVLVRSSLNREFELYQNIKIAEISRKREARDMEWNKLISSVFSEKHRVELEAVYARFKALRTSPPSIMHIL